MFVGFGGGYVTVRVSVVTSSLSGLGLMTALNIKKRKIQSKTFENSVQNERE